jgi:hypothetical protein
VRKGHAVTDVPGWLLRLRRVRQRQRDAASDHHLAAQADLSEAHVSGIFSGDVTPARTALVDLLWALTPHPGERESVLRAYDASEAQEEAASPLPILDPRSDTVILADAICDLAQAITELAEALRKPDADTT